MNVEVKAEIKDEVKDEVKEEAQKEETIDDEQVDGDFGLAQPELPLVEMEDVGADELAFVESMLIEDEEVDV